MRRLDVALWFERSGHTLAIRETAESNAELKVCLTLDWRCTSWRHVRMFERFRAFTETDLLESGLPILSRRQVLRWFADLKSKRCGANTFKVCVSGVSPPVYAGRGRRKYLHLQGHAGTVLAIKWFQNQGKKRIWRLGNQFYCEF